MPQVPGLHCSIPCAEQSIDERGCRWCGGKLDRAHSSRRFCSKSCRDKAANAQFGDGKRLVAWLKRNAPQIVHRNVIGWPCAPLLRGTDAR